MTPGQTPSEVLARVVSGLDAVLAVDAADLVLVQGDTTTALGAALAAFHRGVVVGHVEAGLRTGDPLSPFPEEMNRRLLTRIARYHFAATPRNVEALQSEGVPGERIVLTGNTVVDSLHNVVKNHRPTERLLSVLGSLQGLRVIALTTHRRESFGSVMESHLRVLRRFVERHSDVALVFPVHPNPAVRDVAERMLAGAARIVLLDPLEYHDFIHLLSHAWLLVSDSGGVQEEAPSLGKPLLVLREKTERPEVLQCGVGRLVGHYPENLNLLLERALTDADWFEQARRTPNPFGTGDSGERIVDALDELFAA